MEEKNIKIINLKGWIPTESEIGIIYPHHGSIVDIQGINDYEATDVLYEDGKYRSQDGESTFMYVTAFKYKRVGYGPLENEITLEELCNSYDW